MQIHRGRAFLKPHKEHGGLRRGLRHHRSARTPLPNYPTMPRADPPSSQFSRSSPCSAERGVSPARASFIHRLYREHRPEHNRLDGRGDYEIRLSLNGRMDWMARKSREFWVTTVPPTARAESAINTSWASE